MRRRKGLAFVLRIALVALAIGAMLAAPALADPAGKVKGVVTGLAPGPDLDTGELNWYEMQYLWNIHQVDDTGAAKGYAITKIRTSQTEMMQFKVEFDCLWFFETEDGRPAAIYSGKIVKAEQPDWHEEIWGNAEGRLKIGMVIDNGPGALDEVYFWSPEGALFYPDEGAPLGCVVPEGSMMIPFIITGGDVEVRLP
jgi:hypothetical protein